MSDTTGLALATLSALALVRYAKTGQAPWLLLASAAIAYATLTRWIYGLVAIPFAIYALIVLVESTRQWSRHSRGAHSSHHAARETRSTTPTETGAERSSASVDLPPRPDLASHSISNAATQPSTIRSPAPDPSISSVATQQSAQSSAPEPSVTRLHIDPRT